LPSLAEIAGQAYANLKLLTGVSPRSLNMGIQEVNGGPTQQFGSPVEVSSAQFATATQDHLLWWERQDLAFQLEHGGVSAGNDNGEPTMRPAVFLSYNLAVDDATLARVAQRSDVVAVWVAGTNITDAGLASLKGLKSLERLEIADTSVTDAGLQQLEALASLRELNVGGTKVTKAGIERLQQALPALKINAGEQEE
jgi:hypothetical protein